MEKNSSEGYHSELQLRFVSIRREKGVHCTPEYVLQPRRNRRRRERRGHVLRVFREEDQGSWEATLFPWRLWQEHAIRQEGRHLTSDSPDIRVSVIVEGKDRCRGPVERDPLTDGRLTTMRVPPRPLPISFSLLVDRFDLFSGIRMLGES